MVAYCTSKKYGARMLPEGAIQGIQLTRTPGYLQVVGFIDQTLLNIKKNDTGGEADPHGADLRGNPLGALVYSTAFSKDPKVPVQVTDWTYFVGSDVFCFKACDPAGPDAARLCEHVYDRSGCEYNMPANYAAIKGTYQACKGEDQLPVGVYIENGQRKTWQQPPESSGPITQIPYKPFIPSVTECTSFTPASLWPEMSGKPSLNKTATAIPTNNSIPGLNKMANTTDNSNKTSTSATNSSTKGGLVSDTNSSSRNPTSSKPLDGPASNAKSADGLKLSQPFPFALASVVGLCFVLLF